jgi:hypothetical protein
VLPALVERCQHGYPRGTGTPRARMDTGISACSPVRRVDRPRGGLTGLERERADRRRARAHAPLLLHRLGLDRFGIWSLALVVLSTLAALDRGVSSSSARKPTELVAPVRKTVD